MEFFMIQIEVSMMPGAGCNFFNFDTAVELVQESYQNVYDFFKNQIDQNIILNLTGNVEEDTSKYVTRYFATTISDAQAFEQAFSDMSVEFSMKKFWNHHGVDISIECNEIDFDTITDAGELIGANGEIWDTEFQR
jgi:hypothetical protein